MKHNSTFRSGWEVLELSQKAFWEQSTTTKELTNEQLRYLCQYALLAPSSHNTIPERFKIKVTSQEVELILDRFFVLPQSDAKARQAIISLGAVLHHLKTVAAYYQLDTTVKLETLAGEITHVEKSDQERYIKIANVRFHYNPQLSGFSNILQSIKTRKTVRALYDKTISLPDEIEAMIVNVSKKYTSVHTHIIKNQLTKQAIAKFQEQADRFVMENKKFAYELGEWLLPNDEYTIPYGMRGAEYGFDDAFAATIHNGLVGKTRLFADQIATFAKGGKAGIESSSAILVITAATDTPSSWLEAGELYDEICLLLTEHGLVTAMHAALTEVDWASAVFKTTVLKTTERPLVLLRIGKTVDPEAMRRPHAARPDVDSVLIN